MITFDSEIFSRQKVGGISRYFVELYMALNRNFGDVARIQAPFRLNEYLQHADPPVFGYTFRQRHLQSTTACRVLNRLASSFSQRFSALDILHYTDYSSRRVRHPGGSALTVFDLINEKFPEYFGHNDQYLAQKREAISGADYLFCISQKTRDDLIEYYGVAESRVKVTYLSCSDIFRRPQRSVDSAQKRSKPFIVFVGQRGGYKNFELLLRAYALYPILKREVDVVAFGGGDFSVEESQLMQSLAIDRMSVRQVAGGDEELLELYRNALALIYPSLYEGFGIPVVEAMAAGCPVVCSRGGSIPEVAADCGYYFDVFEPDALAEQILGVYEDAAKRSRRISEGLQRAQAFSWDRCARETMDGYRTLGRGFA